MKTLQLTLIVGALSLTACGGSDTTQEIEQSQAINVAEQPVIETDTSIEQPLEDTLADPITEVPEILTQVNSNIAKPMRLKISTQGLMSKVSWKAVNGATAYQVHFYDGIQSTNPTVFVTSETNFSHQGFDNSVNIYRIQAVVGNEVSELSGTATADFSQEIQLINDSTI